MTYLILDTNIYLHFKDFEDIDWCKLVDDEEITIFLPYTVLREIEKKKDEGSAHVKKRAKRISSKFSNIFLDEKKGKFPVVLLEDPSDEELSTLSLNPKVNDDVILGTALVSPNKNSIVIISADNPMLIKSKHKGLKWKRIPEGYKLSEDLTQEEKEIKELKEELALYKNRQSKPSLIFHDGSSCIEIIVPKIPDFNEEFAHIMQEIRQTHPYKKVNHRSSISKTGAYNIEDLYPEILNKLQDMSTPEQREQYNKDLDEYFHDCEKYYRFRLLKKIVAQRLHEVDIYVTNTGTKSTGKLFIEISFPPNIHVYSDKSTTSIEDVELIEPQIYMNLETLKSLRNSSLMSRCIVPGRGLNVPYIHRFDLDSPVSNIHRTNSSELTHNVSRKIEWEDSLYVDVMSAPVIPIKWTIADPECVRPQEGTLILKFKYSQ